MPVETIGFDELQDKLRRLGDLNKLIPSMRSAALHIKGKIAKYPEKTEANIDRGPGSRWYERGKGAMYHRIRDNGISEYGGSKTLGRQWTIGSQNRGLTQVVGNNVSYGPYVQSREKQASVHTRNKWQTIQDVTEQEKATVVNFVKREIDRLLAK